MSTLPATRTTAVDRRDRSPVKRQPKVIDGAIVRPLITPARIAGIALAIPALVAGWQGLGL